MILIISRNDGVANDTVTQYTPSVQKKQEHSIIAHNVGKNVNRFSKFFYGRTRQSVIT